MKKYIYSSTNGICTVSLDFVVWIPATLAENLRIEHELKKKLRWVIGLYLTFFLQVHSYDLYIGYMSSELTVTSWVCSLDWAEHQGDHVQNSHDGYRHLYLTWQTVIPVHSFTSVSQEKDSACDALTPTNNDDEDDDDDDSNEDINNNNYKVHVWLWSWVVWWKNISRSLNSLLVFISHKCRIDDHWRITVWL